MSVILRAGLALSIAGWCIAAPAPAVAEILDTTATLGFPDFSLGVEAQGHLVSSRVHPRLNLHGGLGLAYGLELYFRQGVGLLAGDPHFSAAGIKWQIVEHVHNRKRKRPGLALWGGAHVRWGGRRSAVTDPGLDFSIALDYGFWKFRPYIGLDLDVDYVIDDEGDPQDPGDHVRVSTQVIAGCRFLLVQWFGLFAEGSVGLAGHGPSYVRAHHLAVGARFYIDL